MKKFFFTLCTLALAAMPLWAQDIAVDDDSLYTESDVSEFEFYAQTHVRNNGSEDVTLKWERNIEQLPEGWTTNFCDKNLCYASFVTTAEFDLLANGDEGLLKPLFRPNGKPGTCIYRITLTSLTPGIDYTESIVWVAVATGVSAAAEVLSARDVALYPNPATDELTVAVADAHFKGDWLVTNAAGQIVLTRPNAPTIGQMDISGLSEGLYFLHLQTEEGQTVVTKKFIIQ